jgi:glycosyltransferase involved in cell wall biosynthesis
MPDRARVRALWLSRWERFKALDVLAHLARLDRQIVIDAFGPVIDTPVDDSLPPNLRLRDAVTNLDAIAVEDYDVLIFTSYFEGMPNVVLEMAAAGIPIVASDVGGLRETFSPSEIALVEMDGSVEAVAEAFRDAIGRMRAEGMDAKRDRIVRARQAVVRRHGHDVYLEALRAALDGRSS